MFDESCRNCGIVFGTDGRSFRFENVKKPICLDCEIKRLPKKTLVTAINFGEKMKKLINKLKKQARMIGGKDYHFAVVNIKELEKIILLS